MRPGSPLLALLLGALLAAAAGCGFRAGLPAPEGARTLAVAWPGNDSRLRDLELEVGLALSRSALERLDLEPATPAEADLVLRGRVVDLRGRGGVRSPDNELLEAGQEIRIVLELEDRRSGQVVGRSERALEAGFLVPLDTSPFRAPEVEPTRARVVRNLAEGLLLDLFAPPAYEEGDPDSDAEPAGEPEDVLPAAGG